MSNVKDNSENSQVNNEITIENLRNEISELKAQLEGKEQSIKQFNQWWNDECEKTKNYKEQLQALQTIIAGILAR